MTHANPELDGLDGTPPETITLSNGSVVRILDLKTRQFFRLLRIVTHGAGGFLMQADLNLTDSPESFAAKLLGIMFIAVPDSEDETIAFLSSMVTPDGLIERPGWEKDAGAVERNKTLWSQLNEALVNPEMEDTISIVEAVILREAADIQSLGKRLQKMWTLASKTGQTKPSENEPSVLAIVPNTTMTASIPMDSSADSLTPST